MKHPFIKAFLWGAGIFGAIHLALDIYFLKEGGDASMAIIFIDYPLSLLAVYLDKIPLKLPETSFYFYYLGLGTLMYSITGGILLVLLIKMGVFLSRKLNFKRFLFGTVISVLIIIALCIFFMITGNYKIIDSVFIGRVFVEKYLLVKSSLFNLLGYSLCIGFIFSVIMNIFWKK